MKDTNIDIAVKIGAAFSFCFLIGGGGFSLVNGFESDNWVRVGIGFFLVLLGLFTTAVFVAYIAKHEGDPDAAHFTFIDSVKGGLTFTFFSAFLIFIAMGVFLWAERGLWQIGIAAVSSLFLMILTAILMSVRYQNHTVKKVLADPDAIEIDGVITDIEPNFYIMFLRWTKVFFYSYRIDINGIQSVTYLRSRDPRCKKLRVGDMVKVKLNPDDLKYCAIVQGA